MISIRVSDEEYAGLRKLCSLTGARSVSDLARDALNALLNTPDQNERLGMNIDAFRGQITSLGRKIDDLATRIDILSPQERKQ